MDILFFILRRIKHFFKLVVNPNRYLSKKESYYPNDPQKSKFNILIDQLYFILKYGGLEKYYFTYGFDRKSMTFQKMKEYIINEGAFLRKVDYHNDHINKKHGRFSGRAIISDKFYFYLFLKSLDVPTPRVFFYSRNGGLLYIDKTLHTTKIEDIKTIFETDFDGFAKPYGGQLGDGAFSLKVKESNVFVNGELELDKNKLIQTLTKTNYIVQERIVQHPRMNRLCSTSLNTIRLQTLITENEEIIAFSAGVRMGREGSIVDNWAKGGVFVGIDMNTGRLHKTGYIKPPFGKTVIQHPDNGLTFEGFEIPFFKDAVAMAKDLHSKLYRIHSIGWDIAITENGPMFIEGNSLWEISLLQASSGGLKSIEKYFD